MTLDDSGYDSGRAFRAKRRSVRICRSIRSEFDLPFVSIFAQDAVELIRTGENSVDNRENNNGDRPA
ncbi:hypothetical protein [Halocatena marina]|uniref:hypothetical protein n=1 Tax=Halocatena marina TaxID=2934937 RepID=UPI00200D5E1D|nr:hypothetical protein [Halocatena marina]